MLNLLCPKLHFLAQQTALHVTPLCRTRTLSLREFHPKVLLFNAVLNVRLPSIHAGIHVPDAIREHGERDFFSLVSDRNMTKWFSERRAETVGNQVGLTFGMNPADLDVMYSFIS